MADRGSLHVERAKEFFRDRILAAAVANNTALSRAEIAMLTYSELDATAEQHDIAHEVDTHIGEEAYERKIESLIRAAYKHDVAHGMKNEWKAHLRALREEDLYVLIMAERAGVFKRGGSSWHALLSLDVICFAALVGAGVTFFMGIGIDAVSSDSVRVVLFLLWIAALWTVGEWSRRRIGRD
jgi:hypothetical protein